MPTEEKYPITLFQSREKDEQRVEGGGPQEPPKWILSRQELEQRSAFLCGRLQSFRSGLQARQGSLVPYAISCLNSFDKFRLEIIHENSLSNYKLKLLDFKNYEFNTQILYTVKGILTRLNIEFQEYILRRGSCRTQA